MTETQLMNSIIEFLNYQGAFCMRINAGLFTAESKGKKRMIRGARKGTSDILGVYQGRFFAFEVKKPETRAHVSPAQEDFLQRVRLHQGIAAVVTSPEEALELLKTQEKEGLWA